MADSSYNFGVRFDKSEHEIDTETYVQALSSLTTIVKEANYQLDSNEKISVSVVAQESGSFDVGLALKTFQHLLSKDNVDYLAGLVGIVGGLYALRKHDNEMDKSKTIINGDDVTIKNVKGDVVFRTHRDTYNIYTTNQVVQDALSANFKSLEKDGTIEAFEIKNSEDVVRFDRGEFQGLSKKVEIELPDKDNIEVPANLVIVKLVFEDEDRKWEFLYNGVKIGATVLDDNFWAQVNNGKAFAKGDALVADLRIIRELDPTVAAYINKDYQVVNIREHHPKQYREQLTLEDIE